jgi:hypothetical protein
MHQNASESHAIKLAALSDVLEQRSARAVQATEQAAERLGQSVAVSEQTTARALESFRHASSSVLTDGMRQPLRQAGDAMLSGCQNVQAATLELKKQVEAVKRLHLSHAIWAFAALVIASLGMAGVAVYAGMKARQEFRRAEWGADINAAVDRGVLTACPEGGLCVYADKKWVRLDTSGSRDTPAKRK